MKHKNSITNLVISVLSLLLVLVLLELGLRFIGQHKYDFMWSTSLDLVRSAYPAEYDGILGWAPKKHFSGTRNVWGTSVNITENGYRSNGNSAQLAEVPLLLSVGDSYTFGDEVSDQETWPAFLESKIGAHVINAGVFGYGLDQSMLRAEIYVKKFKPDALVFSFIPDDVRRTQMDIFRGTSKPYFRIVGEGLELCNTPPPKRKHSMSILRETMGWSYLVNEIMFRIAPKQWLIGSTVKNIIHEDEYGLRIARLIFNRLAMMSEEERLPVFVIVQYPRDISEYAYRIHSSLNMIITPKQLHVLDLYDTLLKIREEDPDKYDSLYFGGEDRHMTTAGNQFVADKIAAFIVNSNLLKPQ